MEKDLSLVYDLQTFLLVRGISFLFQKSIKVTTDQNCQISYCKMLKKYYQRGFSEFKQQDGRTKRTAKRLWVTNVTGLLRMCFVVIFT